jgi:ketosteroid isomerase-like protein
MYKWAVRRMIRRNVRALTGGDPRPLLAGYAEEAVLVFPGESTWSGEHRGKVAIEAFLRRFLDVGIVGEVHDILVNGPPWRTTVCVLFCDQVVDATGAQVYENRAILFGRIAWGKIRYHEDFEDTQKVAAFDRYLAHRAPSGASGSS